MVPEQDQGRGATVMRMTVGTGVADRIIGRREDSGFSFLLSTGDLCQMSAQEAFLKDHGFEVGRIDVYPALRTQDEYDRALRLIYEHRVDGWWNFREKLMVMGVCTDEQFMAALHRMVEARKGLQE